MDAATLLREARQRSGLTQRSLARRARTSHSTLAAYESGTKVPTLATLVRIVEAAGFGVDVTLTPRGPFEDRVAHGDRLEAVLELAEAFPVRHRRRLAYPRFRRARP